MRAKAKRGHCEFALISVMAVLIPFVIARAQDATSKGPDGLESAPSMASHVPRKDLLLYFEFKGLDAQAQRWQKTAAYRLLSDTKLGVLLEDIAIQAVEIYQETAQNIARIKGVDAVLALKRIARHGFAFAFSGKPPDQSRFILVLPDADHPEFRTILQGLEVGLGGDIDGGSGPGAAEKAGRTLHRFGGDRVWWVEKGTAIVTDREKANEILDVIEGRSAKRRRSPPAPRDVHGARGFRAPRSGIS